MGGGDVADDGQAQAGAVDAAVEAIEALEDAFALRLGNTRAVVFHLQHRGPGLAAQADRDLTAARGVSQGIVDQVVEQVAQLEGVALHGLRLQFVAQVDAVAIGLGQLAGHGFADQFVQPQRLARRTLQPRGGGAGQGQQLVGLAGHAFGGGLELRQRRGAFGIAGMALAQPLGQGADAGQRGAQLVGHVVKKGALVARALADAQQQAVEGGDKGAQFAGRTLFAQRRQVIVVATVELTLQPFQGLEAAAHRPEQLGGDQ